MKNKITAKQILHIAKLSKISMTEEKAESYVEKMNTVLEAASVIVELPTESIEEMSHTTGVVNITAEDIPEESLPQSEAIKNAGKSQDGYIIISQVLGEE